MVEVEQGFSMGVGDAAAARSILLNLDRTENEINLGFLLDMSQSPIRTTIPQLANTAVS